MRNQAKNRYLLNHFLRNTNDYVERLADGQVATITRNGEAVLVAMSPETYDAMRMELDRGYPWDSAIRRHDDGERGTEAKKAIDHVAKREDDSA